MAAVSAAPSGALGAFGVNKATIEDAEKGITELAGLWEGLIADEFEGLAPGTRAVKDVEFVAWFEMMAKADPNWPVMVALEVPADFARWIKLKTGVGNVVPTG